jgi:outer membrane lipoprotein-sorting protein
MRTVRITAFMLAAALAASVAASAEDFVATLKKVDAQVSFDQSDFSAECAITQTKPGEGVSTTVAALFRRDSASKYLILILEPKSDKGKGYLKIDQGLWLYQPKGRTFQYTSSKERFQNSNARNSDFTHSNFAGDYAVTASSREKLDAFDCLVLELKAASSDIAFPITKIWISDEGLVRKKEDYSLSRQLLRTTAMPSYQAIGSRYVPLSITIVDALRGKKINGRFVNETTIISIMKPSIAPLPDALFTKAYLEKFGR